MAVALDTTTYPFSQNISDDGADYRVKEMPLGDGYGQSEIDGINYDIDVWQIEFIPLADAASLTLKGILKNSRNGTANVLSWTPPGEATTKYWKATNVKRVPSYDEWIVSCTLTRSFPI